MILTSVPISNLNMEKEQKGGQPLADAQFLVRALAMNHHQQQNNPSSTSQAQNTPVSQRRGSRDEIAILPESFVPTNKDVICGRQRENFHHDGNKYFRELIQKNIGPYIGSRTKLEKGDAIVRITKIVKDGSPSGGFVKKDERTGRWYRIKDSEARDKVGHAIRKAVQRLEDTQPKLAARLRKEYSAKAAANASNQSQKEETAAKSNQPTKEAPAEAEKMKAPVPARVEVSATMGSITADSLPQTVQPILVHPAALSAQQGLGLFSSSASASSSPALLVAKRASPINASTVLGNLPTLNQTGQPNLLAQSLSRATTNGSMFPGYDQLLTLRLQEQRSQDELNLIRALQQQEEAKIRREIEYSSQRVLPLHGAGDQMVNLLPLRVAAATNPLLQQQLQSQLGPLGASFASQISTDPSQLPGSEKTKDTKDMDIMK